MKPQEKPAALAQPQQEPVKVQKNEEAAKVQTRPQTASSHPRDRDKTGLPRPEPAQGPRARADPREQLPEETLRIRREDRVDPRVREAVFQAREIQETEAGNAGGRGEGPSPGRQRGQTPGRERLPGKRTGQQNARHSQACHGRKAHEKEGRVKNERGSRNDRRNEKPERGDRLDRMERNSGKGGQKNLGKNKNQNKNAKPAAAPKPVEKQEDVIKTLVLPRDHDHQGAG